MRLRRWKVERELIVTRSGIALPAKPEFFFTERGARSYVDFARCFGGGIRCTNLLQVGLRDA